MTLEKKTEALKEYLRKLGSVAVAFSGGVDSALLLCVARESLGERALALTAALRSMPERELAAAEALCRERGIEHVTVPFDEFTVPGFRDNPPDRCYHCKRAVFQRLLDLARERGLSALAEGSNADDAGDYRPGMTAVRELGVLSPLREAGLRKEEIRRLARERGLAVWDKPSYACLATRFPYGESITPEGLELVDRGEKLLLDKGFTQLRLRLHGRIARLELLEEEMGRFMEQREELYAALRALGFAYVTLDLGGYRTGSMNEVLDHEG